MNENVQMLGNVALMELPKVAFLSSRRVAPAAVVAGRPPYQVAIEAAVAARPPYQTAIAPA